MKVKEYDFIKKMINKASNVFIMGHKNIDLDAFGATLGIYCYVSNSKKKAYIILDDKKLEKSVKKALETFNDKVNIIKSKDVEGLYNKDSLLVIVDTNKPILFQNSDIVEHFRKVIVIDHHNLGSNSISSDEAHIFTDTEVSSTCEIITNMLDYHKYLIDPDVATVLLAGIVLDTNNFVIRTKVGTYYAAYYLSECGADSKEVQYLFKQDIKEYIEMQKVITEVKVVKNIAISRGLQTRVYRREELAKIADIILLFNNIEASFVIGKVTGGVAISARSMGNICVGPILEGLGGGGDDHEAATLIKDKSLNQVFEEVVKLSRKL